MVGLELKFTAPNRPMSINEANKLRHWAPKRRRLDPWKDAVQQAWLEAAPYQWKVKGKPTLVSVVIPFEEERRRDPHNYTGTIVKTVVDALVTKRDRSTKEVIWQGAWPDDTPEWVQTAEPILVSGTEVIVRLIPLSHREDDCA